MPPTILDTKPRTDIPDLEPVKPTRHWRRWVAIAAASFLLLAGVGFAAAGIINKHPAKTAAKSSVASNLTAAELKKINSPQLPTTQLDVTTLTAQTSQLEQLLAKALQVTNDVSVQGNVAVGGGVTSATLAGNGSKITGVDAVLLDGEPSTYFTSLTSGTASAVTQLQANAALLAFPNTFLASNTFSANLTVGGASKLEGTTTISSLILGSPLAASQGGTGLSSVPADSVLYGQGGPTLGVAVPGAAGLCLESGVGNVTWGPCTGGSAVFSLDGLNGALALANSTGAGATLTIDSATTAALGIASFNAANFSVVTGAVNTIQDIAVTSTPTFGGLTLSSALPVASGGTGAQALTNNGVILGAGAGPLTAVAAGAAGECLISNVGAPSFQACPGAGGVLSVNGLAGALTIAGATGAGSTLTIQNASTAQLGLAEFNSTNFTVASGIANTIQNIDPTASPTFAAINTNNITPTGSLTVGSNTQNLTLQGANTLITAKNGANVAQLTFVAPTANVVYRLQTAAAGTYDVCTTAGNCGDTTTAGGVANTIPKYTSATSIGPSLLTDNGTLVTVGGNLSVTGTSSFTGALTLTTALSVGNGGTGSATAGGARTNLGAAASGANSDITSLAGLTTALSILQGGTGATSLTANGVLLGNGTSPVSSLAAGAPNLCLVSTAAAPTWAACTGGAGGGVTSLDGQIGVVTIANSSGAAGAVTIDNASTAGKGIAQFNSGNFSDNGSGLVNTIQDIATTSAPAFGQLSLTSSQAANPMLLVNNTNGSATGNLIDLQLNGSSKFTVAPSGTTQVTGSFAASGNTQVGGAGFLGKFTIQGTAIQVAEVIKASGGQSSNLLELRDSSNNVNASFGPGGNALTLGRIAASGTVTPGQLLFGDGTTDNFAAALGSDTLTAGVTYNLPAAAAGSYDLCTSTGNCLGGASGGANTALSNLASVAINTSLLPGVSSTIDAGSSSLLFRKGYFASLQAPVLQTADTAGASTNSQGLAIVTGNALGSTSNSGNLTIDTGTATGTTGTISVGGTNASGVTIGNSAGPVSLAGNTSVTGTNTFAVGTGGTTLGGTLQVNNTADINTNSTTALNVAIFD